MVHNLGAGQLDGTSLQLVLRVVGNVRWGRVTWVEGVERVEGFTIF